MEIKLRPYQIQAIEETRKMILSGKKRFVFCSPTGSGKTFTFSFMVKSAIERGKRVLILTHRTELLTQAGGALNALGLEPVKIEAGKNIRYFTGQLYTGMIETISRRMNKLEYISFVKSLDLIIIDECHFGNFDKFMPEISQNTVVIGFTATPHREKNQKSLDTMYQSLIEVVSIPTLIEQGFLSDPDSYGVTLDLSSIGMKGNDYDTESMGDFFSKQKLFKGVIENYKKICPGTKAIAFTPNVKSSKELRDEMIEVGLNAKHIDGTTPSPERKAILQWFKNTPNAILCNCSILTTGFDEPTIDTVILYRATKSLPLFLQMVGRGSRVIPGVKSKFNVLDFGNNILTHGFWESERIWSLKKKKKRKKGEEAPPVKECKSCGGLNPISVTVCKYCDKPFPVPKKSKQEQEMAYLQLLPKRDRMKTSERLSLEEKAKMAKQKLINPYWVLHRMKDRSEAEEFVRLMGWKPGWWKYNESRFPNLKTN
jgi:superfamily II DNA or RNA helicase